MDLGSYLKRNVVRGFIVSFVSKYLAMLFSQVPKGGGRLRELWLSERSNPLPQPSGSSIRDASNFRIPKLSTSTST